MKKRLFVLSALVLMFLINEKVYAETPANEQQTDIDHYEDVPSSPDQNSDFDSSSVNKDLEVLYERLYDEGYDLGEGDGYKGRAYDSFNEQISDQMPSEEFKWFKMGYSVGYEKGKRQKEEEEQSEQAADFELGEEAGYAQGVKDYKNAAIQKQLKNNPSQSEHWNKGYTAGYEKAVQLMDLSVVAKSDGYSQGLKEEEMTIPSQYSNEDLTSTAFEQGFKKGEKERIDKLKKKYKKEAYKQGHALRPLTEPDNLGPELQAFFQEQYEKGKQAKKKEIRQTGFDDGFTYTSYVTPKAYKSKEQKEWYKQGFESNKDANKLRKAAYEAGRHAKDLNLPKKYKDNKAAVAMSNNYYERGKAERDARIGKILIGGGFILSAGALMATFIYRRKRSIEDEG
ncbi:hypothetical protein FZC66_07230 [Priestia megaterium]|nr:hypothetical protein FZC66_07230 [Priestia megaterium]